MQKQLNSVIALAEKINLPFEVIEMLKERLAVLTLSDLDNYSRQLRDTSTAKECAKQLTLKYQ